VEVCFLGEVDESFSVGVFGGVVLVEGVDPAVSDGGAGEVDVDGGWGGFVVV